MNGWSNRKTKGVLVFLCLNYLCLANLYGKHDTDINRQLDTTVLKPHKTAKEQIAYYKSESKRLMNVNLSEALCMTEQALTLARVHARLDCPHIQAQLSQIYRLNGRYDKALEHAFSSLNLSKNYSDTAGIFTALYSIARVYHYTEDYQKAHGYVEMAFNFLDTRNQPGDSAKLIRLRGHLFRLTGNYKSALRSYRKGQALLTNGNSKPSPLAIQNDIGKTFLAMGRGNKAVTWFTELLKQLKQVTGVRPSSLSEVYINLSKAYLLTNNGASAVDAALIGLDFAKQLGNLDHQKEHSLTLSKAFELLGDFGKALHYQEIYTGYWDQLMGKEMNLALIKLENDFLNREFLNRERHAHSMRQLQLRKFKVQGKSIDRTILSIVCTLILIFVILIWSIRFLRHKHQISVQVLEQRLLRAQLKPHFVFNVLELVRDSIYRLDTLKADHLLSQCARLVRTGIRNSDEEWISLKEELNMIAEYIEIQNSRFQNNYKYVLQINTQLEVCQLGIPPLLLQPFVENAYEHGLKYLKATTHGKLELSVFQEEAMLHICLMDNGVGREKAQILGAQRPVKHLSRATKITQKRVGILNKRFGEKVHFSIRDVVAEDGSAKGTEVIFKIPFKYLPIPTTPLTHSL